MPKWEAYLKQAAPRFLDELLTFLSIPSISSLPAHAGDVNRAAEWVAGRMRAAGLEGVRLIPTEGHPAVYGEWLHAPEKPTALIYGHFDTQPVDPVDEWSQPPFQPVIRDGRVYARGASDDKGNMLVPILAVEAMLKSEGALPINLKFLFEGEEEIGSPNLPDVIARNRDLLACDLAISADGSQWAEDQPSLLVGLKGACAVQIDVFGTKTDLHSGLYGGAVQNPIHALVRILDSMRSPDGRILIEGFFDDVIPLTQADREHIKAVPYDEARYKEKLGVDELFGEPGYSTNERTWARPTLELNGIWGGFQEEGIKTVIPRQAHAKISCRLVANQDPEEILARIAEHVERHTPPGVRAVVHPNSLRVPAYLMPAEHPGNRAAGAVLRELYGREPYYIRLGGSLPICTYFLSYLNAYTVNFAFALNDERQHAPDEFFRLSSFALGQKAYCKLFDRLSVPGAV